MPLNKNNLIDLHIKSISSDGNGVGHRDNFAVFVPNTAVGDILTVRIVKTAKAYAYGRIEKIIEPGPQRVALDCPIAERCGGCCFRHLAYTAELTAKQQFVSDALQRIGHISQNIFPILPSPMQNRYRNKVQFPVSPASEIQRKEIPGSTLQYGFYAMRSHRVIPCGDCLLQPVVLNDIAARAAILLEENGVPPYDETTHTGLVRHIYLRQGGNSKEIMLCFVINGTTLPNSSAIIDSLSVDFPDIKTILLNVNTAQTNVICGSRNIPLMGDGCIRDSVAGVPVRLDPFTFAQVNTKGAEQLFDVVKEYAGLTGKETLLDLYCGTGVIGLSLAMKAAVLIGVEIVPQAVEAARQSAAVMGLSNTRFLCSDAGRAARQFVTEGVRPDVVVLDPPRKGCDTATLDSVVAMGASRVVMVSCNPATLARDLAYLQRKSYQIVRVQPVDLFPRTRHVECVVLITRKEG